MSRNSRLLDTGQVPVIYRYVDWLITVPVQVLALYFFIGAVQAPPIGLFWRLLVVAVVTILARYMGEVEFMNPTLGFLIGIAAALHPGRGLLRQAQRDQREERK